MKIFNTAILAVCLAWLSMSPCQAYTVAQTKTNNVVLGTSFSITVTSTTSTNFLVVSIWSNTVAANTLSVTDSASETWTSTAASSASANLQQTFYVGSCASGVTSVTVHQTASGASMVAIFREYASVGGSVISAQKQATSSVNPATSGTSTTTAGAGSLVVGVGSNDQHSANTWTVGAGYSNFSQATVNYGGGTGNIMIEDKSPGSLATQAATFGNSNSATTVVSCLFNPATAAGQPNYVIVY